IRNWLQSLNCQPARIVRALLVLSALVVCLNGTTSAREPVTPRPVSAKAGSVVKGGNVVKAAGSVSPGEWQRSSLGRIDPGVFNLALGAANCAARAGTVNDPSTITVIDYSKP